MCIHTCTIAHALTLDSSSFSSPCFPGFFFFFLFLVFMLYLVSYKMKYKWSIPIITGLALHIFSLKSLLLAKHLKHVWFIFCDCYIKCKQNENRLWTTYLLKFKFELHVRWPFRRLLDFLSEFARGIEIFGLYFRVTTAGLCTFWTLPVKNISHKGNKKFLL